ncbi:MAG: 2-hydroxyacid dehydrogenase [Acidimicrobiales bacterium]
MSALVVSVPDRALREALGVPPVGVDLLEWDMKRKAPRTRIDLVVPPYGGQLTALGRLADVATRLVQSQQLGYDGVVAVLPPGVVYANAASVHEASTSELAVALILASLRGLPEFVRAAAAGRWSYQVRPSLADRRVLLVGYGGVGRAIEARLAPFETTVTRVARRARHDERGEVFDHAELPRLLGESDVVVVAVPLDDSTRHMVDDSFLSRMRDGALLVNVARGPVADTEALVTHARRGRLRLALDVTEPEPLPAGHPLWTLPNVLISPHVGGATTAMQPRMARLVNEQIARLRAGAEPLNVVLRT